MQRRLMLSALCAGAALALPSAALAHDGRGEAANAGTVSAFSNGSLTIAMADGSSVTGRIDDRTDIECIPSGWLKRGDRGHRRLAHSARGRATRHDRDGHRDHGRHRGHHRPFDCDASALTAGTVVREADLKVTATGLAFDDVELIKERATG